MPYKDGFIWKIDVKPRLKNHNLLDRLKDHMFIGRLSANEGNMLWI